MKNNSQVFVGIDDATKCPCIGSIFIAGVAAGEPLITRWQELGVRDSKLLSRKRRDALDRVIRQTAPAYAVRHIPLLEIDDKSLNLNSREMVAFLKILNTLHKKLSPEKVIVDNWEVTTDTFFRRLEMLTGREMASFLKKKSIRIPKRLHRKVEIIPEHRADENHVIVGAASILARAAFDRQYDRYRRMYGDFGSGSPGDPKTRIYVWKQRHNPPPIIRRSWNTYKGLCRLEAIEDDYWYRKKRIMFRRFKNIPVT